MTFTKGYKMSEEHKEKIRSALRGKPKSESHKEKLKQNHVGMTGKKQPKSFAKHMSEVLSGRVFSKETIEKMRLAKLGKPSLNIGKKFPQRSGENHWKWMGGKSSENTKIRTSPEYKAWRREVFRRDGWTCQFCGYRSKGKVNNRVDIEADHIKSFSEFPELVFEVSNGRTLCVNCHIKHTSESGVRGNKGKPKKRKAVI